jgi:hypothetical protein
MSRHTVTAMLVPDWRSRVQTHCPSVRAVTWATVGCPEAVPGWAGVLPQPERALNAMMDSAGSQVRMG